MNKIGRVIAGFVWRKYNEVNGNPAGYMSLKCMKRFWTDYQELDMSTALGYKRHRFLYRKIEYEDTFKYILENINCEK